MSCNPFGKCFDFINKHHKTIVCTDQKSSPKYIYENIAEDALTKYKVDGCLIDDDGSKCDFLLLNCDKEISYFIELKGSDLMKAVEQIDRSIELLHKDLAKFSIEARIVLTRVNTIDLKNPKLIKLENKLKKLNGRLIKQTRQFIEKN